MPQIINSNILSLTAQRNLNKSQSALATSLQRLSSGLRINSAKDDAAGLAISERFTTQIRGLNQAIRNSNDGISLAQTAEGALAEVTANMQRIRELAVQSANATNSASDRTALDQEVQQRIAEIDRVATQTSFNGQKVLDGSFGTAQFQVGANVAETITVNLNTGVTATQMGQIATQTAGNVVDGSAIGTNEVTINGSNVVASALGSENGQTVSSAYAKAKAINSSGIGGVTAEAISGTLASDNASQGVTLTDAVDVYTMTINTVQVANYTGTANTTVTQQQLVDQVNLYSSQTGVTASINGSDLELTSIDGRDIALAVVFTDANTTNTGEVAFDATTGTETTKGSIKLTSTDNITINDNNGGNGRLGFGTSATISKDSQTLNNISVTSVTNAETAITRVDAALTTISNLRSTFGAIQNRFESTITNLSATVENLSASRSRIQDADFASETANLTRAQILQQAGVSVLSQANAQPQSVLALLQ